MTTSLLNVTSSVTANLPDTPLAAFTFPHLLLNHRVQWHMLHRLLTLSKDLPSPAAAGDSTMCCGNRAPQTVSGVEGLPKMWEFFTVLYEHHQAIEDKYILPAIPAPAAGIGEDHTAMLALLGELNLLVGEKDFNQSFNRVDPRVPPSATAWSHFLV